MSNKISLSEGSGGVEMQNLIKDFAKHIYRGKGWDNTLSDGASIKLGDKYLVFTTDSFIVDPLQFPGGDIGKVAACGTINDLSVMGADPLGISMAAVIEEGLDKDLLMTFIKSANKVFKEVDIPLVTGDTKVMEKGKIDKLSLTTSGIGIADKILDDKITPGDIILVSGSIGDHAAALLSKRFDFETDIISDCKPLIQEMRKIRGHIKQAKDITRGGLSGSLNEFSSNEKVGIEIEENSVPVKKEVKAAADLLGLDYYDFACEGRLVCICKKENKDLVLKNLKTFNPDAAIIGKVIVGNRVILNTTLGKRIIEPPRGNLIPRIC